MHVGQPEYDAGFGAGERAKAAGVTSFLCVNHYITNPASVERCQGYADALGVELGSQMIDSGQDPAEIKSKVTDRLARTIGPRPDT
jgi:simple sugar transport system substrate-binding protein